MKKKFVSIDFGKARIGLAHADAPLFVVLPLATVLSGKNQQESAKKICQILHPYLAHIEKIVIGKPLLKSGNVGEMAAFVEEFANILKAELPKIEMEFWDERFSSAQAEASLKEQGLKRKERAKHIDALSAMIILESYLVAKKIS